MLEYANLEIEGDILFVSFLFTLLSSFKCFLLLCILCLQYLVAGNEVCYLFCLLFMQNPIANQKLRETLLCLISSLRGNLLIFIQVFLIFCVASNADILNGWLKLLVVDPQTFQLGIHCTNCRCLAITASINSFFQIDQGLILLLQLTKLLRQRSEVFLHLSTLILEPLAIKLSLGQLFLLLIKVIL